MGVAVKKLTWNDIRDFPESAGRTEIVDGELVMSPTPSDRHQRICTRLGSRILEFVELHDLGEFYSSPVHVILAEEVNYEPDLCFISKDRLQIIQSPVILGPPSLVIEVISESNRTHDTVVKFRDYERYGVPEYWVVDPREQYIRIWSLESGRYVPLGAFGRGQRVVTRILDGLTLDPAQVF